MGASWVRRNILDAHRGAKLFVLAIWEPILAGDSRTAIDRRMFRDPRVQVFWDPRRVSGRWFGERSIGGLGGGIVWDAYYAFGPSARWSDEPSHVVAAGSDIIGSTDGLERSFEPLLR